jgi:hypothetical protein
MKQARYEIRKDVTPQAVAKKFPELAGQPIFRVWDGLHGKYVPFGNYSDRDKAQARIDRLESRDEAPEE